MKTFSKIKIFSGVGLILIGLIVPLLRLAADPTLYLPVIFMTESIWLTAILLGVACIITGLIGLFAKSKKDNALNLKTEIYAHSSSLSLAVSLYFFLMWQIISLNNMSSVESGALTASIIITAATLLCFFIVSAFYFRERKKSAIKKGLWADFVTVIVFFPAFFFLADTLFSLFN